MTSVLFLKMKPCILKALINCKSCKSSSKSPYNDICPFLMKLCILRVSNMINYILSPWLQLSTGEWLSLWQETKPSLIGFPLVCCDLNSLLDHNNLLKRNTKSQVNTPFSHIRTLQNFLLIVFYLLKYGLVWLVLLRSNKCNNVGRFSGVAWKPTRFSSQFSNQVKTWMRT